MNLRKIIKEKGNDKRIRKVVGKCKKRPNHKRKNIKNGANKEETKLIVDRIIKEKGNDKRIRKVVGKCKKRPNHKQRELKKNVVDVLGKIKEGKPGGNPPKPR